MLQQTAVFALAPAFEPDVSLRVQTPRYELRDDGVQASGYGWHEAPGAPRLPVYGTVVELPAEGAWEITYRSEGEMLLPQIVRIPAVPAPDLPQGGPESWLRRGELPDAVPAVDRPNPAIYQANALYPAAPVVPGQVQWQGGRRLLALQVFPFQYNPVTGQLRYHPDLQIRVRVQPVPAAAHVRASAALMPLTAPDGALRIRVRERGMYRLTYADLAAAGIPLATVNPASFVLRNRDLVTQIQVTGVDDGRFDDGDLMIFYGVPYEGRYMTDNVYQLTYSSVAAAPETRMASRSVTPDGLEPIMETITSTTRIERDRGYHSDYPIPTTADHYFDDPLYPTSATPVVSQTYALSLAAPVTTTGQMRFQALFYGGKDQTSSPDQAFTLTINSHQVAAFQWDGRVAYTATATASAGVLNAAANQLTVTAALAQLPGLAEYWVYPDWLQLSYPAQAVAAGDRLYVEGVDVAGVALQLRATGFTTETVLAYDVRDPLQPVALSAVQGAPDGAGYRVDLWDHWAPADPPPSYFLTTAAALAAPAAVEADALSDWRSAHTADYIAIVHRSLWGAIQPLLDRRAAQGLRVAQVDVQDIYDEFNGGLVDPEAIRSFLHNAYQTWNPGAERPKYVLLVGDGHYDFKFVSSTKLPNLIPPYLIDIDPWIGETAADNRYVSVDGPDDYLPDMAVGRIPANTPDDVAGYVAKIAAYEDETQTPSGDWQNRVVYVADDYANSAGNFHALSDEVRTNWLPPRYTTAGVYYRLNSALDTGGEMRAAIKAELNQGALYLQWFGHGNAVRWGSVSMYNIYDPASVDLLPNNRMAFTTHFDCWSGYFIWAENPYGNGHALGEVMLLQPAKSSIADFSPSGLHLGSSLSILDQGLTLAIFRDRIRPVGEAVNAAKLYYFANSDDWHDVLDTMVLFGDPALSLRVPVTPPAIPTASIQGGTASVQLSWPHLLDSAEYEIWRGTTPYFDPAADEGTRVTTVAAGFRGAGPGLTFTDDGTAPSPSVTIIGDPATNYFWVVRSRNGDGVSAASNRIGEFDFALTPGQ